VPLVYNVYSTCAIGQLRSTVQAPASGNEAHVAGWGRPVGGQRRSVMTAAAVGVGGLALWRGHPARRCPALCVHRAAADQSFKCIFYRHYVCPVCPSMPTENERDGLAEWGEEAPNLPSRLAVPMKDFSE